MIISANKQKDLPWKPDYYLYYIKNETIGAFSYVNEHSIFRV
jgi:hypothetical protein